MQPRTGLSNKPPWSCICKLHFKFDGHSGEIATGWVAGDNTIVTAAHAVSDATGKKATGGWGVLGQYRDQGLCRFEFESHQIFEGPGWEKGDNSWDIAVIQLKRRIRPRYSYLRCDGRELEGGRLVLAGYPKNSNIAQFGDVDIRVNGARLSYQATTTVGMSGGPLFVSHGEHYWVLGVHTDSQAGKEGQAVLLDKHRTDWINDPRRIGAQ